MSRQGSCETGCAERRLLLVRAATLDTLADAESQILSAITAMRPVAERLADAGEPAEGWEAALEPVRSSARAALSHSLDARTASFVLEQPAEPAVTWWCDHCDGVDAPQPCLGICVWRPVEWARYELYAELRGQVADEYELARRLRTLLWRVAHTNPHPGQHSRAWKAYGREARDLLAA